ncbi:MAG: hypothetical protein GEU80_10380 [Dehalococcoidia bacterium]|nr:hypothetical protein [Dehalococcoidia bacterium]
MSLEVVRDIVIVVGGAVSVLFLVIVLAFAVYLFLLYRRTRRALVRLRASDVDPIVAQVVGMVTEAKATATFFNDYGVRNVRTGVRTIQRLRMAMNIAGQLRLLVSSVLLLSRLRAALRALREVGT